MRSLGKGVMSATTQVKVLSLEITNNALGQGVHFLEASIGMRADGECISDVPRSESVAGERTVYIGTWENRIAPKGSGQGAEKVTRPYGVSVVGPANSRGVAGVMPGGIFPSGTLKYLIWRLSIAIQFPYGSLACDGKGPLEGISDLTQRGEF
jgi:hypothetical protein